MGQEKRMSIQRPPKGQCHDVIKLVGLRMSGSPPLYLGIVILMDISAVS